MRWVALAVFGGVAAAGAGTGGSPHVADAKREYAAVFAHPDNPCQWTDNVDYENCMGKEIDFTEGHLEAFVAAMRAIAADADTRNQPNPGTPLVLVEFDKTNGAWHAFRRGACQLQFAWFDRGTGGPPAAQECELALDRSYMKMLAGFFNLHELA